MASRIENYAFLSNLRGSAVVSREGSVDWLCLPRFDSDACLSALVGHDEHGCFRIYPAAEVRAIHRRYRKGTLILETDFECDGGSIRLIDFMPFGKHSLVRVVEALEGTVTLDVELGVRFGYGRYKPWITTPEGGIELTVAPDACILRTGVTLGVGASHIGGAVTLNGGERVSFELTWHDAHIPAPAPLDCAEELRVTEHAWTEWAARSTYHGAYAEAVNQSLVILKGMIYNPSGGIVAAPTAALPEDIGGVRNWDYRYCWLRDATLTLEGLMRCGYREEAEAWRSWLLRAIAGAPEELQIMYGVLGERRLTEFEATWLPGYEDSRPVRIGNAASEQFQLDVYGEVINAIYEARVLGAPELPHAKPAARALFEFIASAWQRPDDGIWEVRGGRRHFVHSKLMAWVAIDRMIKLIDLGAPNDPIRALLPRARMLRDTIHRDICEHGFDTKQNAFTQSYNSPALDASALLIPAYGFLPASDPRVVGTIRAVEQNLLRDGFVLRYATDQAKDGLTGGEGAFLACSFWLVDAYVYAGRRRDAEQLFERLLALRNDLGLLSEEYEPRTGRLVGNFPQAFSHLALIHSASVLDEAGRAQKPKRAA